MPQCRVCQSGPSIDRLPALYGALGRKLLQPAVSLPCCAPPQPDRGFCGSSRCTLFLAAGVLGVTVAAMGLCALLIYIRTRGRGFTLLWWQRSPVPEDAAPEEVSQPEQYVACDVAEPSCEQFGGAQECPICWDRITSRAQWRRFACCHGTCADCHAKLLEPPGKHSCCPLCRLSLVRPISPPAGPEATAETSERRPPETNEAPSIRPDSDLPEESTGIAAVPTVCSHGSSEAFPDCSEESRADREGSVRVATNSAQSRSINEEWLAAIPIFSLEELRAGQLERTQTHGQDRQQKPEPAGTG